MNHNFTAFQWNIKLIYTRHSGFHTKVTTISIFCVILKYLLQYLVSVTHSHQSTKIAPRKANTQCQKL